MSKEYLEALEIECGELVEMDLLFLDRNGENQEKWHNSEAFEKAVAFEKKYGKSHTCILKEALQRLEAIENALEICKKANEQRYVYIKVSYGIVKDGFFNNLDYEVINNRLYVNSRGIYYNFPLKDYGIWWALTKEELENE